MAQSPEARAPVDWTPTSIGDRIRILRMRRRISQRDLAEEMNRLGAPIEASMISRYELYGSGLRTSRRPQLQHLIAMARIFGVTGADIGITPEEYPELRLLKDPESRAILEATPS